MTFTSLVTLLLCAAAQCSKITIESGGKIVLNNDISTSNQDALESELNTVKSELLTVKDKLQATETMLAEVKKFIGMEPPSAPPPLGPPSPPPPPPPPMTPPSPPPPPTYKKWGTTGPCTDSSGNRLGYEYGIEYGSTTAECKAWCDGSVHCAGYGWRNTGFGYCIHYVPSGQLSYWNVFYKNGGTSMSPIAGKTGHATLWTCYSKDGFAY